MNIALVGYGKMGRAIERIGETRGHYFPLKICSSNQHELDDRRLSSCDVAIEFSTPSTAFVNIETCLRSRVSVVCGSTGWERDMDAIQLLCKMNHTAFMYEANYSIGVHIFLQMNKFMASRMNYFENYDVSIKEIHHTQKKDTPSGTAIETAKEIINQIKRTNSWTLSASQNIHSPETIPIESIRKEDVVGQHDVLYKSDIDSIVLSHRAHNRSGFALGALLAAEYIQGREGVFSMQDVINHCLSN